MKYVDLFAGIGGFNLGIKNAHPDWECVYSNEWDKYANSVYKKHFGECDNRDIRTVNASEIPDHDLLVGGFPCQAFSVAGKRGGFDDTRGTLFFEIARILRDKRPRYLLLENVKGLLSHDSGKTFQTILRVLSDIGYGVQWQVLNSKDFGVPQNRERVFIVGHLRGTPRPQVFPIESDNGETSNEVTAKGQLVDLTRREPTNYRERKDGRAGTLDANYYKGLANQERPGVVLRELTKGMSQGNRVYDPSGVSTTIASQAGGLGAKTGLYAIPVLTPDRAEKRQNGRRFKTDGEPSFTLTGQDIHGVFNGTQIRRLTPVECERLQGFEDGWTEYGVNGEKISDTQRYKMCGNAVTTNVVTEIVKKLDG